MSEETIAAGGHRRWWPDGTMMARLDERTGAELVSLVPGIRYREGSGTPGRPLGRAGNDGGPSPWPGRRRGRAKPLAGQVTTAGPSPRPGR